MRSGIITPPLMHRGGGREGRGASEAGERAETRAEKRAERGAGQVGTGMPTTLKQSRSKRRRRRRGRGHG
jgi:hypothetical protein